MCNGSKHVVTAGNATRQCMEDGSWFVSDTSNRTWSNYSECIYSAPKPPVPFIVHSIYTVTRDR